MEGANMNEESPDVVETRRRALVAGLRTGRWEQARQVLARIISDQPRKVRYCCLGVACEVAIANGLELARTDSTGSETVFYGSGGDVSNNVLPRSVSDWYGWDDNNPSLKIPDDISGDISDELYELRADGSAVAAAELNDEHRLTFAQIADCFEYTFLPQDWESRRGQTGS